MKALIHFLKRFRFLVGVALTLIIIYAVYFYFYFSTVTDNAFIVAKVEPVASSVSGKIIKIYVNNDEVVKKGQALFSIDPEPFKLNLEKKNLKLQLAENKKAKLQTELAILKTKPASDDQKLNIKLLNLKLEAEERQIQKAKLSVKKAQMALQETTVYADNNGIVSNLFIAEGTPAIALKPLFAFIDTDQFWVQANFKETDLAHIKQGDQATIRLKMYLGKKIYQGHVTSNASAVSRRVVNPDNLLQNVQDTNQWVLPVQRFPVLISIDHPDPNYPLYVGASAYVSIDS